MLDQLAADGVRFSNFHTAANCAPSRAMMLTGVSNHLAGFQRSRRWSRSSSTTNEHLGTLSERVVTIASLLEASGYHPLSGKWHLGSDLTSAPIRGFEQTHALMESGAITGNTRRISLSMRTPPGLRMVNHPQAQRGLFLVLPRRPDDLIHRQRARRWRPFFAYLPFKPFIFPCKPRGIHRSL